MAQQQQEASPVNDSGVVAPVRRQPRDWWSATGTGWGPNHDQPNPFAKAFSGALQRLKRDVIETGYDLIEEPGEVPFRVRHRIDQHILGGLAPVLRRRIPPPKNETEQ